MWQRLYVIVIGLLLSALVLLALWGLGHAVWGTVHHGLFPSPSQDTPSFTRDFLTGTISTFIGFILALEAERLRTSSEQKERTKTLLHNVWYSLQANCRILNGIRDDLKERLFVIDVTRCDVDGLRAWTISSSDVLVSTGLHAEIYRALSLLERMNRRLQLIDEKFTIIGNEYRTYAPDTPDLTASLFEVSNEPDFATLIRKGFDPLHTNQPTTQYRGRSDLREYAAFLCQTLMLIKDAREFCDEAMAAVSKKYTEISPKSVPLQKAYEPGQIPVIGS